MDRNAQARQAFDKPLHDRRERARRADCYDDMLAALEAIIDNPHWALSIAHNAVDAAKKQPSKDASTTR